MRRKNQHTQRIEKSQKEKDKDEERRQRYKALRAKVKAETQQNANEYKLSSRKGKKRNNYTLTAKSVKSKPKKKRKKKKKKAKQKKTSAALKKKNDTIETKNTNHSIDEEKKQNPAFKSNKMNKSNSNTPYYLRKHEFSDDHNNQSVSANEFQRNKYKQLLKVAQQTEWRYTQKYMSLTYGTRDYSSIFESTEIDFENMLVKICMEMLLILHESWSGRIQIVSAFVDQLCVASISNDVFAIKMCKFLFALGFQFSDSRSLVIQAMKRLIHRLCSHKPQLFLFFAPYLLQQISQTWSIRIQALREAGEQLSQSIIFVCFPFDEERVLMYIMFELMTSKHGAIRAKSAEFVHFMCHNISKLEKLNPSESEEKLLNALKTATISALNDATSSVRHIGYKMLFKLNTIAPNTFNAILQTLSKAQIKKLYDANGLKQNVIDTASEEKEHDRNDIDSVLKKHITDYNFDLKFQDTRSQPRDLEKRIKDVFVSRHTKVRNKQDKSVLFKDLVRAERIGIYNNMPLLTLLNDVYVRCKMDSKYNKLFNVDYFLCKYGLTQLPQGNDRVFASALKQYQFMMPIIWNGDRLWTNIQDDGQLFVNYSIGFLRFLDHAIRSHKLINIKQMDLVIIPRDMMEDDESVICLRKILKRNGLKYTLLELKDGDDISGVYDLFCKCFKDIEKEIEDSHIVFVIDRNARRKQQSCVKMYAVIVKDTVMFPYNDIMLYPEFHIGKSKQFLFGKQEMTLMQKKKKKRKKAKRIQTKSDGILGGMQQNKFALFCQIWNTDCVRLYSMINHCLSRFVPYHDMLHLWPVLFKSAAAQKYTIPKDVPLLRDTQFEAFHQMIINL